MKEHNSGEYRPKTDAWKPRRPQSYEGEYPAEPLAWYWKLFGYGGQVLIYALGVCYVALTIAAMFYYVIAFARFVLR
ncbi:hypothetical protein SAMN04487970_105528 [Paenibacillus tianmuensis]|uniref:Uncharacterized protein n=1 Tax=Paenibacillus tianmuensis TaxID=624147 RepID=A0A1G4TJZ3_9BACL|nr:hypothetical protein SAMN04487970_105528 [Paenibacillus tianmuensis]